MGGTDDPNNIIELSVEEHAKAHFELYQKTWQARRLSCVEIPHKTNWTPADFCRDISHWRIKKIKENQKPKIINLKSVILILATKVIGKKGDVQKKKLKLSSSMKNNMNSKNHSSSEYKAKQSIAMKKAWAKRKINNFRRDG